MTRLLLAEVDRDEALTEAIGELYGGTRAAFLRTAALGSASMLATLSRPATAAAAIDDLTILRFGLRFERLQATFYTQAEDFGTVAKMAAAKQRWAQTLGAHERAHVRIFKHVLGKKADPPPTFDFGGLNETDGGFTKTAVAMEDLTVALLTGVAPQVRDKGLVAALMGLLTVEARHAAWARHIVGATPAPKAFDRPRTLASVAGTVKRTHFIVGAPKTSTRRRPKFTG